MFKAELRQTDHHYVEALAGTRGFLTKKVILVFGHRYRNYWTPGFQKTAPGGDARPPLDCADAMQSCNKTQGGTECKVVFASHGHHISCDVMQRELTAV